MAALASWQDDAFRAAPALTHRFRTQTARRRSCALVNRAASDLRRGLAPGALLAGLVLAQCGVPSDDTVKAEFLRENPSATVLGVASGETDGGAVYKSIRFRTAGSTEECQVAWEYQRAGFDARAFRTFHKGEPRCLGPARSECDQESERVFGSLPTRVASAREAAAEPKTVRHVNPKLPSKWPKQCRATVSVHEVLIAPTGKVERVFTLKSPCAEFDRLVTSAIAQWEFTPTKVAGKAVPACVTMTTLVDLR
jgi:hypothetical protein